MSSPMDDNPQHIFSQVNTTPSNNINTPYPATNIMLQHGLVNGRSSSNNPFDINHHQYMATMATKQEMFRNYAELQQRQRQGVPFTLQQQQQQQQQKQQHNLVAQAMNNYMHTNYTNHFDSANTSDCYTDHGNHILYNMAEQEKQKSTISTPSATTTTAAAATKTYATAAATSSPTTTKPTTTASTTTATASTTATATTDSPI